MDAEQRKKITGFFILEAQEHNETLSNGIAELAKTLADYDTTHECYRAAHSIKGGAAMLDLESIRKTAHRLEDYFKFLRDNPTSSNPHLEKVFQTILKALQEQLTLLENSPTLTLSEAEAEPIMAKIEPIFATMMPYLEKLAKGESAAAPEVAVEAALPANFAKEVLSGLRDMLQILKQPEHSGQRQQLVSQVRQMQKLGGQITSWHNLLDHAIAAIQNQANSNKTLASIVIKEIKQAQELVVANRAAEIVSSPQLQALLPELDTKEEVGQSELDTLANLFSSSDLASEIAEPVEESNALASLDAIALDDLFDSPTPDELEEASYDSADIDLLLGGSTQSPAKSNEPSAPIFEDDLFADLGIASNDAAEELFASLENSGDDLFADLGVASNDAAEELFASDSGDDLFADLIVATPSETATEAFDDLFADSGSGLEVSNEDLSALDLELDNLEQEFATSARGNDTDDLANLFEEQPPQRQPLAAKEFDALNDLFASEEQPTNGSLEDIFGLDQSATNDFDSTSPATESGLGDDFADIEAMLSTSDVESFDALDQFLTVPPDTIAFDDLDALLKPEEKPAPPPKETKAKDDFRDMEELLGKAETIGGPTKKSPGPNLAPPRGQRIVDQIARVPVRQLDNLNNLMGELVVNRNSLEQDQERLRQFLDNLMHHIQHLTDVGARMQDLYERSLLESSLLASRQQRQGGSGGTGIHDTAKGANQDDYDPLEMDRFTGFHLLSQEMIELIVRVKESASDIEFLVQETDQVARMLRQISTQLQEGLTKIRMMPFKFTTDKLPLLVRTAAQEEKKQVEIRVEGQETLIDKMIQDKLSDPMKHLINNAVAHGVESPEVRQKNGKPPTGKIVVKAFHQGNQTVISISDDGGGIDPERVRNKAIQRVKEKKLRGLTVEEIQRMSKNEIYELLFVPGFSTRDESEVTQSGGRGVGMDVIKTNIEAIRGTIGIESQVGKGTTFTIRLPMSLSIGKALRCLSDHSMIAFPIDGVEQPLDNVPLHTLEAGDGENGHRFLKWHDQRLEIFPLHELLTFNRHLSRGGLYGGKREDDTVSIIVLRGAGNYLAVQVDQILGEQEIVIKQLEGPAPKPVGIAGATVLGDGKVMPIADVLELIELSTGNLSKDKGALWDQSVVVLEPPPVKSEPIVLIVDDSITVRELLSLTFTKSGYRVEQARDGQEAWDKLISGLPCDIVFCDIEMPKMTGLELLSKVRGESEIAHLPFAMLTSRGGPKHQNDAAKLGATAYFTKPYLEDVLLDAAQRMLKGEVLLNVTNVS
jgi:chemotaxis protein histidine kinase CheA/CheY-like chemotaxis protein